MFFVPPKTCHFIRKPHSIACLTTSVGVESSCFKLFQKKSFETVRDIGYPKDAWVSSGQLRINTCWAAQGHNAMHESHRFVFVTTCTSTIESEIYVY